MIKKASINCWSSNEGEYLFKGNCFENDLLELFKECKEDSSKEDWYILLENQLEIKKSENHPQDILDGIFRNNVSIDFDFSDKLKMFDILLVGCFISDNELGKAILELCDYSGHRFIVSKKYYTTTETIKIHFEVCHEDFDYDLYKALITQSIKS